MARYMWDDEDLDEDDEYFDRRAREKDLARAKRDKDRERQDAIWSHERATRDDAPRK